jgi:glycosyltransferase involved in cell wall biosynthesis
MKLLYFTLSEDGGIADYAHAQANALVAEGADVTMLCTPRFCSERKASYHLLPQLRSMRSQSTYRILRMVRGASTLLSNFSLLAQVVRSTQFTHVLFDSYVEYLAPLWSGRLRRLATEGVVFAAVVHDPVRDFVVGPHWWHRLSIASGYSFLREAFVHAPITLDTAGSAPQLTSTVIPHGTYDFAPPTHTVDQARASLRLPPDVPVLLAFGYLRDNKNLDLAIRSLAAYPDLHLVIAGSEQSSGQRPATYYRQLAEELGVAQRCRWEIRRIPNLEIGNFFAAADAVLLTYSSTFRSASGVLNLAAHYQKPSLVSSGAGSLQAAVQDYQLGVWVEPDDLQALIVGIGIWLKRGLSPQWERYQTENSWGANARLVLNRLQCAKDDKQHIFSFEQRHANSAPS